MPAATQWEATEGYVGAVLWRRRERRYHKRLAREYFTRAARDPRWKDKYDWLMTYSWLNLLLAEAI